MCQAGPRGHCRGRGYLTSWSTLTQHVSVESFHSISLAKRTSWEQENPHRFRETIKARPIDKTVWAYIRNSATQSSRPEIPVSPDR